MGTSRSGRVGSSTRWKVTRNDLKALSDAVLADVARSVPPVELSGKKKKTGGGGVAKAAGESIPQPPTEPRVPSTLRAFGMQLVATSNADKRFDPKVGDCAVKVVIEVLIGLVTNATIKYRMQRDAEKLFAEYGIGGTRNIATALAKALDQRYREDLIKKCKKATDSAEKARQAMQRTVIELLAPDGTPGSFIKLNADGIHAALRKTHAMKVVERVYANYLYNSMALLVSSIDADITATAEKHVVDGLRITYCEYVAKEVVKRAGKKGWRPSEIPDKADDWYDLLVETEEVHA